MATAKSPMSEIPPSGSTPASTGSGSGARLIASPRNASSAHNDATSSATSPPGFGLSWMAGQNGSPLSRAGLLQPKSLAPSVHGGIARPRNIGAHSHVQEDIRDSTMQLSSLPMKSPSSVVSPPFEDAFIFPTSGLQPNNLEEPERPRIPISESLASVPSTTTATTTTTAGDVDLTASGISTETAASTPRGRAVPPSALTIMMQSQGADSEGGADKQISSESQAPTPTITRHGFPGTPQRPLAYSQTSPSPSPPVHPPSEEPPERDTAERQPLLTDVEAARPLYCGNGHLHVPPVLPSKPVPISRFSKWMNRMFVRDYKSLSHYVLGTTARSLPAVLLGLLLNLLDGISYGMIIFPTGGVFANLGGVGVSMFFVSAIISQLVYSAGGSGFDGANGSMMIEVVPFFHNLANSIALQVGEDNRHAILATTMVAYAMSSILTGLAFFLLGALRMGSLIGFFPRHILVGGIGGIGIFLIITGFAVCTRISESDFEFSLATLRFLFLDPHNLALWAIPFALAVLLRVITSKYHHQLIFPLYFVVIPVVFYIIAAVARLDLADLRRHGWLFDMDTSHDPWYKFYTFYDFGETYWSALWSTLPTQFALLFFNILHPPLNVPALAVSLNHDVDTNKELVGHGYSNLLSGALGTVPNYLVYVNTLLFYRVGGITRIAGFLLAGATVILLVIGTGPISYIPVMVVGALIFVLGIDLVKEALWDTRHRVSWPEYITILSIMICMTVWDFVIGIVFGIVMSCFFFVIQSSRRRSIRALHTGETAMSTVRRPSAHRAYLRDVTRQTTILRLQGFVFFGTITQVEEAIRTLVGGPSWQREPMRFLVVDLTLVAGVDMSAAEAFVRVQRLLAGKGIILVFSGLEPDSAVGRSLSSVGLLDTEGVEVFSTYSDALEWTENTYLRAFFMSQKIETDAMILPGRQDAAVTLDGSMSSTPRRSHLLEAGYRTIARSSSPSEIPVADNPEPCNTLVMAFSSYGNVNRDTFLPLVPYLERMHIPEGYVLWEQGEPSDGLYIVESGILRATYYFAEHVKPTHETMVPGTLAGELSGLSGLERNARCVVERHAILWKLSNENMRRLEREQPEFARTFTKLVLKAAKLDYDTLIAALASRQ